MNGKIEPRREQGGGLSIRATLRLRNDAMISARERMGFSQKDVGELAGVSHFYVGMMERLDFDFPDTFERVQEVADVLGLVPQEIMPEELAGKIVPSTFVRRMVADTYALDNLMKNHQDKFILPSPDEMAERSEMHEILQGMTAELPYRQRETLRLRERGDTLEEVGRAFNISRERVRQIEAKAHRMLKNRIWCFQMREEVKEANREQVARDEQEWEKATR